MKHSYILTLPHRHSHIGEPLSLSKLHVRLWPRYHTETFTEGHECSSAEWQSSSRLPISSPVTRESDSVESDSSCSWLVSSDNWLFLHTEWSGCQSLWSLSPYLPLHSHKARSPTVVPCSPLMHFLDNAWRELAELECTVTSALLRIRYSLLNVIETKTGY